jgi:glycosyltransferase involved in cell wall biosynthesis/SAM-dependent methyltransferase
MVSKNKIYIPFDQNKKIGGPSSFLRNLKTFLDDMGFEYSSFPNRCRGIFFPISYNIDQLNIIRSNGGKIIQRLDGIYYPTQHGEEYEKLNQVIKDIYLNFSDFIIFQSEYSKKQCFAMLGEKNKEEYTIITNGVNKNIFFPSDKYDLTDKEQQIIFITGGDFRKPAMIEPITKSLDKLTGKYNFKLYAIGPISETKINHFFDREYIEHLGPQEHNKVARLLRGANIYLHSQLNDCCPNAVLEAISCGLPIVGFDSGSMSELLNFSKELLAPVSNDLFHRYEDFDHHKLADKIKLCVDNFKYYKQLAIENHHLYSFEECGNQYLQIFKRFTNIDKPKQSNFFPISSPKKFIKGKTKEILQKDKIHSIFKEMLLEKPHQSLSDFIENLIKDKTTSLSPFEALQFLFDIENRLYRLEGQASVRYGNGIHTKHMHIRYHDFFINNIPKGSRLIDIGCGNGALTYDIAKNVPDTTVYGIDLLQRNIETAKEKFRRDNITYVHGDALQNLPNINFDIIVLSNVLEHIEKRVEFLIKLKNNYHPQKFLIRVPVFERDWRVPLKRELGVDYRLDATHHIEYTYDEFFNEMKQSGLTIKHYKINWGEIWSEAVPDGTS